MAARCGWCGNSGFIGSMVCTNCPKDKTKRYFPGIKAKKKDDTLKSGHRHTNDLFMHETKTGMWFTCKCGQAHKVEL
jgi:hypothetical protein